MSRTKDYSLKKITIKDVKLVIWGLALVEDYMESERFHKQAIKRVKELRRSFIETGNKIAEKKGV